MSTRSKNILMLDRSTTVVDRRIVLEAKTLRKMGCNVLLLCITQDSKATFEIVDGLSVIHLPEHHRCKIPSVNLPMAEWIAKAESLIRPDTQSVQPGTRISSPAYTQPEPDDIPSDIFKVHFEVYPLNLWETQAIEIALAISDIDVVHMHDAETLRPGIFIAKRSGLPTIFDAHEIWPYLPGPQYDPVQIRASNFNLEAIFVPHCTRIVTVNKQLAEIIRRDYNYDRIVVFTNATERPPGFDVHKRYSYVRDRIAIPPEHKIMLFTGYLSQARKVDQLLAGMTAARPDLHMVFLTFNNCIPPFQDFATKIGIGNRVHFFDLVPWNEILFWCASVDVGVMPYQATAGNMRFASPNKMYEFIAAATPMIGSSDLVNVKEIVGGEDFGLLAKLQMPTDYAKLMNDMFDETLGGPERFRKALIEKGDKYLLDQEISDFVAMYRQVLNQ